MFRWISALIVLSACSVASAVEFHVAPGGDDAGPGTREAPFGTLQRARDAVRALKAKGPLAEAVTVTVADGRYTLAKPFVLRPEDGGTTKAQIVDRFLLVEGARHVRIEDCEFGHLGIYVVWFRKGCRDCTLTRCYLHDFGAGGQPFDFAGKTLAEWQAAGHELGSIIADPKFKAPAKDNFELAADSPAIKLGFKPFDYTKAGVYGRSEWVRKATAATFPPLRIAPDPPKH